MSKEGTIYTHSVPVEVAEILISKGYEEGTSAQHIMDQVILCASQLGDSLTRITDNVLITVDTPNQSNVLKLFFRGNEAAKTLWLQIGNLRTAVKEYNEYFLDENPLSLEDELIVLIHQAIDYHDALKALVNDSNPDNGQLLREAIGKHAKSASEKMDALKRIRPKTGRTKNDELNTKIIELSNRYGPKVIMQKLAPEYPELGNPDDPVKFENFKKRVKRLKR